MYTLGSIISIDLILAVIISLPLKSSDRKLCWSAKHDQWETLSLWRPTMFRDEKVQSSLF